MKFNLFKNKKNAILVTGAAGYIGSHFVFEALKCGFNVVLFDDLSLGHKETVKTLISLQEKGKVLSFIRGTLLKTGDIKKVFKKYNIDAVVHFAAFSQVEESVKNPQKYYYNNVLGTLNLLKTMMEYDVKKIVFSSTAATYGEPQYVPIDEKHPQRPINPYGKTKFFIENIMDDYDKAYGLKSVRLRYFNVVGADSNSLIGEWHNPETHLVPNVLKSAIYEGKTFKLFGDDYDTKDGTCVRDYINVEDLAKAHIRALEYLNNKNETNYFNLGTKTGNTTKEIFDLCEKICDKKIDIEIHPRRQGDCAVLVADNQKAQDILNWQPEKTLEQSIKSAYCWHKKQK